MTVLGTSKHAHKVSFSQLEEGEQDIAAAVSSMLHEHGGAELEQQQPRPQQQPEQQQQHHHHQHQLQHQQQQQQQLQHHGHQHLSAQPLDGAGTPCNSCCSSTTGASTSNSASGSGGGSSNGSSSAGGGGSSAGGGGSSGDGSGQQGILLKKLLRRAAVSFRDLNISVHDASTASLVHLSDGSGHAQAAASVLPGRQRVNVEQKKLAIIMVGLPGRGKTFVCNKLKCYLNWLGHHTEHINVGAYRRKLKEEDSIQDAAFFDHHNPVGLAERERAFQLALADMLAFLSTPTGQVAIFDATNSTQERREKLSAALRGSGIRFIFIENICNDAEILQQNYMNKMMYSPDYKGIPTEKAVADFMERIKKYEEIYEPITDRVMHYIKLTDTVTGRGHLDINRISGYLPGKIVYFLLQVCKSGLCSPNSRKIWLTRHGESEYNQKGLIGGDSPLSVNGRTYAELLPDVLMSRLPKGPDGAPIQAVSVWTSTLQRTISTAANLPFAKLKWKALDEIDAGICDGMTYGGIAQQYPAEFEARKHDKLRYRYPRGESYLDLVQRLEPVISEIEREGESICIVSHQAVLRVIFGYLMAQPQSDIPSISIPLHTVIELTPRPDGTMGIEYIPVPVHLSDASMLTHSMDAVPAVAAVAAAAAAVAGGGGDGAGGQLSPLSPLDPCLAAVMGACPFRQDEAVGPAADMAAAAAASPPQRTATAKSLDDASVFITDSGDHGGSSSAMSTGTEAGCSDAAQQQHHHHHGVVDSKPWCIGQSVASAAAADAPAGDLTELPLVNIEEIQRMSSCSSRSSMAFLEQAATMPLAAPPPGCVRTGSATHV